MELLRKKISHGHKVSGNYKKSFKDQLQFERDIEIKQAHRSWKTMLDGSLNKRRTIIAKFLIFKDKQ